MDVLSVENTSLTFPTLKLTREFTPENCFLVVSVGRALLLLATVNVTSVTMWETNKMSVDRSSYSKIRSNHNAAFCEC